MNLKDIPDLKSGKYTARICVALTHETKEKLNILKKTYKKDPSEFVRCLIDSALEKLEIEDAG